MKSRQSVGTLLEIIGEEFLRPPIGHCLLDAAAG